ncbi:hypothetical protein [Nibribacter koreensis]|uniref:Secreted protein n=1 Tax=Nibribacter koreensis TaxID=1084519 RepID=A0ABP8F8R4_9BACT
MKSHFWVFIICLLTLSSSSSAQGTGNVGSSNSEAQIGYKETLALFLKAEKKVMRIRKSARNFKTDPETDFLIWKKSFSQEAPSLLAKPENYSSSLLQILKATDITKDEGFNFDIVKLLYPICIEEYIMVINEAHTLYRNKELDLKTFAHVVAPSKFYCSNVYDNKANKALQGELQAVLETVNSNPITEDFGLKVRLEELLSDDEDLDFSLIRQSQPAYIKYKNCK